MNAEWHLKGINLLLEHKSCNLRTYLIVSIGISCLGTDNTPSSVTLSAIVELVLTYDKARTDAYRVKGSDMGDDVSRTRLVQVQGRRSFSLYAISNDLDHEPILGPCQACDSRTDKPMMA